MENKISSNKEYKFTLKDILLLIDCNGESEEKVIISEQSEEETWAFIPMNSKLLWAQENLERKVDSICVYDGMLQIWLAD